MDRTIINPDRFPPSGWQAAIAALLEAIAHLERELNDHLGQQSQRGAPTAPSFDPRAFDDAVARAMVDDDFRAELLADPAQALGSMGVALPPDVRLTVHEFDPADQHLFLAPRAHPAARSRAIRAAAASGPQASDDAMHLTAIRAFSPPAE